MGHIWDTTGSGVVVCNDIWDTMDKGAVVYYAYGTLRPCGVVVCDDIWDAMDMRSSGLP